jgi:hypothetical protein
LDFQNDGQDMIAAISSWARPEWADTSFAGGPQPPVPNPLILESPEWGDTDRAVSSASSRWIGPSGLQTRRSSDRLTTNKASKKQIRMKICGHLQNLRLRTGLSVAVQY